LLYRLRNGDVLGVAEKMNELLEEEKLAEQRDSGISSFGIWARDHRIKAGKSVPELAKLAGIHPATLWGIENGKFQNPQSETKAKLAKALKLPQPPPNSKKPVNGLGELTDFDPHSKAAWPSCSGVYVLYDKCERPIYVGKGQNISVRLKNHSDKFWYKSPIVEIGSYIEVKDETLRTQLEQVLIKFLKKNAVINVQGVA
jgi:transcriptional regulator with XRE-family HTH domain